MRWVLTLWLWWQRRRRRWEMARLALSRGGFRGGIMLGGDSGLRGWAGCVGRRVPTASFHYFLKDAHIRFNYNFIQKLR